MRVVQRIALPGAVGEVLDVDGVVRIATSPALPRPHVAVFGCIHGNEPCGLRAIDRLCGQLTAGQLELASGTLYLIHGNPKASEQGRRFTVGGTDLNRLLDYRFLADLSEERWAYEHHRALALRPILESVDGLIDLHSLGVSTPAFAIAAPVPASRALADALGLQYVTEGWEGLIGEGVTLTPLSRRASPAAAVECGREGDPDTIEVAYQCIRRALDHFGMVALDTPRPSRRPTRLQLLAAISRPSSNFRFARHFASMEQLAANEVIGQDDGVTLAARQSCYVVMPFAEAEVGEAMLFLAGLVA